MENNQDDLRWVAVAFILGVCFGIALVTALAHILL